MTRSSLGRFGIALASLFGLMALFAGAASASLPVITPTGASNKSLNTATLGATVKAGGASYYYEVEYGKTKLYEKSTPWKSSSTESISVEVGGLEPLTTYHYRVKAWNSSGTAYSEDMTFEMLLAWKIEGKKASEVGAEVVEGTYYPSELITLEHQVLGKTAKITCHSYPVGHVVVFNTEYNLPFKGCTATLGGVAEPTCNPPDAEVHLNAFAAGTKATYLELNEEECQWPVANPLISGNYAIPAFSETKVAGITVTSSGNGWQINYGPMSWEMVGPNEGKTFGVS